MPKELCLVLVVCGFLPCQVQADSWLLNQLQVKEKAEPTFMLLTSRAYVYVVAHCLLAVHCSATGPATNLM